MDRWHGGRRLGLGRLGAAVLAVLGLAVAVSPAAAAVNVTVTTGADGAGSCTPTACTTLRAAITAADADAGPNTITLPAGTYTISGTDLPAISSSTTISGAGAFSTFVDGGNAASIHHALSVGDSVTPVMVNVDGVALQHVAHASDGTLQVSFTQSGSVLNVDNSIVRQNTADSGSAGIESLNTSTGEIDITDSNIAGNVNTGFGAVSAQGATNLSVLRSTIAGNSGGTATAICIDCVGSTGTTKAEITNSTISGNTGTGSIIQDGSAPAIAEFSYDTISGNTPGAGAAVLMRAGAAGDTFKGNIISGNNGVNCSFPTNGPTTLGFNFDDGSTCGLNGPSDHPNTPVALGTRGKHGGPTATQPLIGPAAVDQGGAAPCTDIQGNTLTTDQRGLVRPQGAACDAGAVEKWGAIATTLPATLVGSAGATLEGSVNPNAVATTYEFEYGTTTNYGLLSASQSAGSGSAPVAVSTAIAGLAAATVYHYRVVAVSDFGDAEGADQTFTTAANPPPPPPPKPPVKPGPKCTLTAVSSKVAVQRHKKGKKRITTATVSLKATCNQAVNVTVGGTITEALPKKHGKPRTKTFKFAAVRVSLNGRTAKVVVLNFPSAALSALAKGRKESAAFALSGRNANGAARATASIRALRL